MRPLSFLTVALLLFGCGSVPPGSDGGTGGGGGGGGGGAGGGGGSQSTALQCESYGWCTNWESDNTTVSNAPALAGGTITDGIYREEQGWEGRSAFIFKGNTVLLLAGDYRNDLGTWYTLGSRLFISTTTSCSNAADGSGGGALTLKYDYFVQGDELFIASVSDPQNLPVQRLKKVSSLCAPSTSFKCRSSGTCACVATESESFRGRASCF